ncbi:hypothetical protein niasHT_015830 [Heterodera trifolii]|uniref:Transmembrane protein 208 n=1 Tax=Heterodera trifolii TaxID=157864 RepID=A0ABD2L4S3_9BILA
MNQQKSVKRATRGQRQIYEENKQTLLCYVLASICSSVLVFSLNYFLFLPQKGAWIGLALSSASQAFSVILMSMMMKTVRNERNQLVDAGLDLNDPNAFGEYCKDIVILSVSAQLLSLIWTGFFFVLLSIPFFTLYKLWTNILGPWFFRPTLDDDEKEDKKKQKKPKYVHVRR